LSILADRSRTGMTRTGAFYRWGQPRGRAACSRGTCSGWLQRFARRLIARSASRRSWRSRSVCRLS
jgi:hypothetical protein